MSEQSSKSSPIHFADLRRRDRGVNLHAVDVVPFGRSSLRILSGEGSLRDRTLRAAKECRAETETLSGEAIVCM